MLPAEMELITAQLRGYIDALASINVQPRANRASALLVELDTREIDRSVAEHYASCEQEHKSDFPELDVPSYRFEPAVVIAGWVGVLERELEQLVLQSPILSMAPQDDQQSIRRNLAWHVMELIRMISDDFMASTIFKLGYCVGERASGTLYVIPLNGTCLTLSFEASE